MPEPIADESPVSCPDSVCLPGGAGQPISPTVMRALTLAAEVAHRDGRGAIETADLAEALRALSQRPPDPVDREAAVRVVPYRDGPYLVRGDFELLDQDGQAIGAGRRTVALCRCGHSQLRPFCDGTHKLIGFHARSSAERPAPPES